MPRGPRYFRPNTVQHLITRCCSDEFRITGDEERAEYVRRLALGIVKTDWSALGFAIMSSHIHLAALAGCSPAAKLLKPLNTGFAQWLNRGQSRSGPVVAGRTSNHEFSDSEAVAYLLAYIHNNPVRAGAVESAERSSWTSHLAYLGEVEAPAWLQVERGLALAGFDASSTGRANFHDFVLSRAADVGPAARGCTDSTVRAKVRKALATPVETTATRQGGRVLQHVVGKPGLRVRDVLAADRLLDLVASKMALRVERICGRGRGREVSRARRVALTMWSQLLGQPQAELARAMGITPQAASWLLARAAHEDLAEAEAMLRDVDVTGELSRDFNAIG